MVKNPGVFVVKTKKAFTLVELTVAVALLAMMISFSAVILRISIDSNRLASANAEIMQKFRAITDQLNRDFSGLCKDAPMLFWFRLNRPNPADPTTYERFDQIMFFAEGDFTSTRLYYDAIQSGGKKKEPALTGLPVRGNVARIYYGQARSPDPLDNIIKYPFYIGLTKEENKRYRILARRQHILTADDNYFPWPTPSPDPAVVAASFDLMYPTTNVSSNDWFEHDRLSLACWKILNASAYDTSILRVCFIDFPPLIDTTDAVSTADTIHKLWAEGVGSFAIQWAYMDLGNNPTYPADDRILWFPNNDPLLSTDLHFDLMNAIPKEGDEVDVFGVMFNVPGGDRLNYWFSNPRLCYRYPILVPSNLIIYSSPTALKFTFTLYDSKGIIKEGRTFTHIVYLDE